MIMGDGLLSLSWNNHSSTFCHMLSSVRGLDKYSDVTLACDGRFYPAHKLVLSTCSDYFHKMFEKTPCKHPIIVIKDVESKDIEALLSYMYAGIVNVSQSDLSQLIKAAELLEIKGLAVPDEPPKGKRTGLARGSSSSPQRKRQRRETASPSLHDAEATPTHGSPSPLSSPHRKGARHSRETMGSSRSLEKRDQREKDDGSCRVEEGDGQMANSGVEQTEEQLPAEFLGNPVEALANSLIKEEKIELENEGDGGVEGYNYGVMMEAAQGEADTLAPYNHPSQHHTFHTIPPHSALQEWSGGGNSSDPSQGYGGSLGQDPQMSGHISQQAQQQQLHQSMREQKQEIGGRREQEQDFGARRRQIVGEGVQDNRRRQGPCKPLTPALAKPRGRKIHQCPYCWYTTTVSVSLQRHIRTHTGEKPFLCPYCPVRTTRKASLVAHIQGHLGEKPLACPFCAFTSRQQSNMNRHIKRQHLNTAAQNTSGGQHTGVPQHSSTAQHSSALQHTSAPQHTDSTQNQASTSHDLPSSSLSSFYTSS